jgi:DNA-binding response OmpR family regulator
VDNKILVVEDLPEYHKLIQVCLGYKYQIDIADTLASARQKLKINTYKLILLDVLLPDGSGFDFCREIQAEENSQETPIVFLTAKNSTSDKVLGFSIGVDDYIVKPFDPAELVARVDLRILKAMKKRQIEENFKKGPLRFELAGLRLYVENQDTEKKVDMTPIEFKILLKLAQNTNRVFSRQQILDSVWGYNVFIDDRSIDKHISSIRKKIDPYQKFIKTVSGIGYEFKVP